MSRPKEQFLYPTLAPQKSPLRLQKAKDDPEIKSKAIVRNEENIENKSCQ